MLRSPSLISNPVGCSLQIFEVMQKGNSLSLNVDYAVAIVGAVPMAHTCGIVTAALDLTHFPTGIFRLSLRKRLSTRGK